MPFQPVNLSGLEDFQKLMTMIGLKYFRIPAISHSIKINYMKLNLQRKNFGVENFGESQVDLPMFSTTNFRAIQYLTLMLTIKSK